MYKPDWGRLFDFGKDDIGIMKEDLKNDSTRQYTICPMTNNNDNKEITFTIKRIQVLQLL